MGDGSGGSVAGVPIVDVGALMRELGVTPGVEGECEDCDTRPLSKEALEAVDALYEVCRNGSGGLIAVGHGFEKEVEAALKAANTFHASDLSFKQQGLGEGVVFDAPGAVKMATRPTTLHERLRYPRVLEPEEEKILDKKTTEKDSQNGGREVHINSSSPPLVVVPDASVDVDGAYRDYQRCIRHLALALLRAMAIKLGLPRSHFDDGWMNSNTGIVSLHYLALSSTYAPKTDGYSGQNVYTGKAIKSDGLGDLGGNARAYPHADGDTLITLLVHDNVEGLQVLERGSSVDKDRWVDVPRISGEQVVVQIGQMTQRWTNDLFYATPHRVLKPPVPSPARTTISCFFKPSLDTVLEVPPSLRRPNDAGYVYENVDVATFLQLPLTDDNGLPLKLTSNIRRDGSWIGVRNAS